MLSIKIILSGILALLTVNFISACGGGASNSDDPIPPPTPLTREEKWTEDIDFLASNMKSIHPNLFHSIDEALFDEMSQSIKSNISSSSDNEVFAQLLELVALPAVERDGHMGLSFFQSTAMRVAPLRFFRFADGVFVVDATSQYSNLVGLKLVGIGSYNLVDIDPEIDKLNTSDNEHSLVGKRVMNYILVDLLQSIGLVDDANSVEYRFENTSAEQVLELISPVTPQDYDLEFSYNLPSDGGSFYLSNNDAFWLNHFEEEGVLFIKLNEIKETTNSGKTLNEFATEVLNIVNSNQLSNVILDIRQNNGGNNQLNSDIVDFLSADNINQPGKLVVFTDRQTFSAAGNLAAELAFKTNAIFTGTSPGGSGSQFGDTEQFDLPHSNIALFVPTIHWVFGDPNFQPILLPVDNVVEPLSSDYFDNIDPVLDFYLQQ